MVGARKTLIMEDERGNERSLKDRTRPQRLIFLIFLSLQLVNNSFIWTNQWRGPSSGVRKPT